MDATRGATPSKLSWPSEAGASPALAAGLAQRRDVRVAPALLGRLEGRRLDRRRARRAGERVRPPHGSVVGRRQPDRRRLRVGRQIGLVQFVFLGLLAPGLPFGQAPTRLVAERRVDLSRGERS